MIIKQEPEYGDTNRFLVTTQDVLTKQQIADKEEFSRLKLEHVKFVAQLDLENAAGYMMEDEQGRVHLIGYRAYTEYRIDKLFLPPIQLPKPTMTLEEALLVMIKFAPVAIENLKKDSPYLLPKDFVIAREVLGGREAGMEVFRAIVQIFKSRT